MTKILLLSDTHSYIDDAILRHASEADEVWHAGDIGELRVTDLLSEKAKLRAVYGNIDEAKIRGEYPEHNRFHCEDVDVWMTHIGGYPPKYNYRVRDELRNNPPRLFICGHSHILKVMPDPKLNLIHMNPGAVGKHGFHKVRTMLRFTIDGKKIENLEVVEFPK
ncbi:metallophosphoesterase family protein [Winogradskyella maritima]|uniref:Phosphoesterase n=1 Tax=Winogradskyella maritima TaxID=1517766 RepID=A0ABV8ANR8_9FLAO|nr:metallophosphoesterase family protein [Winogradskyella maritima]